MARKLGWYISARECQIFVSSVLGFPMVIKMLWLQSKGTLKEEDRQFGPSLRAAPYNPTNQRVIYVPGFYDKSGLEGDEGLRRKEVGTSGVAGNKKSGEQTAGRSDMETEEFEEELNAGLNGVKGNASNLETDSEITSRVFDLEPNYKEVFNPKGHEAREEGSKILEVGVESNTLNTRACPNELFRRRIEEIDSDLKKYDTELSEKLNGEYERGDKQESSLLRDNGSVEERGEEAKIQVTPSPHKGGSGQGCKLSGLPPWNRWRLLLGKKEVWQ